MRVPAAYTKRTKRKIGVSYDEYGMPYTEYVNDEGEITSVFTSSPKERHPLPLRINIRFLHETRLLRNSSVLPALPFFQDLPKHYSPLKKHKDVEKAHFKRLIIGGGTSGIAALNEDSIMITRELFGDILFDESPSLLLSKEEIVKKLKEKVKKFENKVLYGNYMGKFDEGLLFELEDKFLLVEAEEIVVSTGARTLKPIFKGNWEQGVVSREYYIRKLKGEIGEESKILVLGYNDLAVKTALNSKKAIILAPQHVDFAFSPLYRDLVNENGIELERDYIVDVIRTDDKKLVVTTKKGEYEVSLIVFSVLKQPRLEVTSSMGLSYTYENHVYKPIRENNVQITGGMLGIVDEYLSLLSGEVLNDPKKIDELKNYSSKEVTFSISPYYYGSNGLICECEEVWLEDIEYAKSLGVRDTEEIKRVTGLGTGKCQGKACVTVAGDYLKSNILISFRTPIYPVRI